MEETLIEAVRQQTAIWQVTSRSYRDIRVKENAWKEVARELDISVELAMKKWKSLRDRFVRELKKPRTVSLVTVDHQLLPRGSILRF